ncbi:MAG: hypothetical protein HFG70_07995 [Hungatella sp.]|nr:hypothetical protein [Hungatella sp.]
MKVCLPEKFDIFYPKENKAYYTNDNSKLLRKILSSASDSYCMYCGTSLRTDGKINFHLEHSVDKEGNYNQVGKNSMLKNCKFNFSASCARCNLVYKKRIEKIDFSNYKLLEKCPRECEEICGTYQKMREDYCNINSIILQPIGYKKNDISCRICYNLLRHIYEADVDSKDEKTIFFVEHHIMRFRLNGENFSKSIVDICIEINDLYEKGIINVKNLIQFEEEKRHENIIGKIFVQFLKDKFLNQSLDKLIGFCKLLVVLDAVV